MNASIGHLPANMAAKVVAIGHCWNWTGAIQSSGYGSVTNGKGSSMLAHRRAYEALVGPIPDGLTIDHLCERKSCVNPRHMQPVPIKVNIQRRYERVGICTCHVCISQRTARHPKRPNVDWLRIVGRMQMNLAARVAA